MICDNDDDDTHPIWELNAREHLEGAGWKREKGRASCFLLHIYDYGDHDDYDDNGDCDDYDDYDDHDDYDHERDHSFPANSCQNANMVEVNIVGFFPLQIW